MPRSRERLEKALADNEAWLDSLDPKGARVARLGRVGSACHREALRVTAANDLLLADRVAQARANGRTWMQVAAVLGVSKQAPRERFGEPPPIAERLASGYP